MQNMVNQQLIQQRVMCMKNYALNHKESKKFIKRFKVKKGIMKVVFTKGEPHFYLDTNENNEKTLNKMEEQVINARNKNFVNKQVGKIILHFLITVIMAKAILTFHGYVANAGWSLFSVPIADIMVILLKTQIVYNFVKLVSAVGLIKNFEKNNDFLKDQYGINKSILENRNTLRGVRKKVIKRIDANIENNREPLNINDIDKMSKRQLEIIRNNIAKANELGLDQPVDMNNNPKLIKRR